MAPPLEELDPLADLRESLEGGSSSAAPSPSKSASGAPPPLPPRKSAPAPIPSGSQSGMASPLAKKGPQAPIPSGSQSGMASPLAKATRPVGGTGDPFGEPAEPRMAMGAAPDEKLEFFR